MKNQERQSGIAIRCVREHELDEFLRLMCRAFRLDFGTSRPIYYGDPFFDLSLKRVLFDQTTNQIVSCLTIVPAAFRLPGGAIVSIAGIAGVCTQPEMQRLGHGRRLLEATLADLPNLGFPLACLTAEAPGLYQRIGFEFCSAPVYWQAGSLKCFPAYSEGRETATYSYDQWGREAKALRRLYDRAVGETPGAYQRDVRRWANIESAGSRRSIAVWKPRGEPEAYMIFQEKPENDGVILEVTEMVASSDAGCRALVGFLARRQGIAGIRGHLRGTDLARFGLNRFAGLAFRIEPGMLVRVTDIEGVLTIAAVNPHWSDLLAGSESGLTIRVEETRLAWSQKSLRLFAFRDQSGGVRCALAPADELIGDWISLEHHALAQLVTGFKDVHQLYSDERLRASGDSALALAESLFPASEPYLGLLDAF